MNDLEELLQQRLARLEMGYSLEESLEDVPEIEGRLVQLAAALRETPFPAEDEGVVQTQRAGVLNATREMAAEKTAARQQTTLSAAAVPLLERLRSMLDNSLRRPELLIGLGGLTIFIMLMAGVALVAWQLNRPPSMTAEEGPVVVEPEASGAETGGSATAVSEVTDTGNRETSAVPQPDVGPTVGGPTPEHEIFLPTIPNPLAVNPQTAALDVVHGFVEAQNEDGSWSPVPRQTTLTSGKRIRSGPLTQASLTFFDGSQAVLHSETELSIDQLDAQLPADGFRTVVMTQYVGESNHSVEFRNDSGSRYEVNTPSGSGIARGTQFSLQVTPGLLARFAVTEGRVDVTGLNRTVEVVAGQTSAVLAGSPPETPSFQISGEGIVNRIEQTADGGYRWIIAGQPFNLHNRTNVNGRPQVGDLVQFEGRLLNDGSRTADEITLLGHNFGSDFTLTGEVSEITPASWTVSGQVIAVDENTYIEEGIVIGDQVLVIGTILDGGTMLAEIILSLEGSPGMPFQFTGVIEAIGSDGWTISGVAITVNEDTVIDEGLVIGDVVDVSGQILDDGIWLAERIERTTTSLPGFSILGLVESIDPWQVAGIGFETEEWTIIEPGIAVGDEVLVQGVIQEDGTWVAATIKKLVDDDDDDDDGTIVFIGIVESIDPWIVNGIELVVTADTTIGDDIEIGDLVIVRIELLPDGTWQTVSILPLDSDTGQGCIVINTIIIIIGSGDIVLEGWPELPIDDDDFDDPDDIEPNSVVSVTICFDFDGTIIIISPIIIIYQPIIIILPPSPGPPQPPGGGGNNNDNRNDNG